MTKNEMTLLKKLIKEMRDTAHKDKASFYEKMGRQVDPSVLQELKEWALISQGEINAYLNVLTILDELD